MGLHSALDTLAPPGQGTKPALSRAIRELSLEVLRGGPLSAGMARYPWLFDRLQVRMVEAGEKGGLLVSVLERLADYLEREYQMRMEISKRTLYPKLLLAAFFVIPAIPVLVLAGPLAFLLALWSSVSWVLFFGVPIYLVMRVFLQTRGGREAYDRVKLAIPIIGPLVRKLAIARFGRMLAALYGAGVPIASAMQIAAESSGNAVLEAAGARIVPSLQAGNSIALTMQATGFFPPMIVGMVATGESTGSLDATLDKASQFYEEEALHSAVRLVVVMGVLQLLVMAVLIGIRVIAFYTGMYGGISSGAAGE
jgi:type II secretory pathway component PulF